MANEPCKASKVAIIGKAPSSRDLAPYDDASFDIWTLSNLVCSGEVPRSTLHFEMHPVEMTKHRKQYIAWLTDDSRDVPVMLGTPDPRIPNALLFPWRKMVARFGTYFTNSVSWMIALAIHERRTHIGVYGVDMAQDTEYAEQRPSCEYFLGLATGAGIEVHVPPEASMLKTRGLYGIDHGGDFHPKWEARQRELTARHAAKMQLLEQTKMEAAFLEGAIDSQKYYKQWCCETHVSNTGD